MSIDLTQFYQVFYEESFEGLDIMESGLLELDPAAIDDETINSIFRAAHSIKGGSATFGFSSVAEFTHVLETLLDEVRDGSRSITRDEVDLFLQSVDCLRALLTGLQSETEVDSTEAEALIVKFEAILGGGNVALEDAVAEVVSASAGWCVHFNPEAQIMTTGNEPLRMFWQLAELGELTIETDISRLPAFAGMNVETCYVSWVLNLKGEGIEKSKVEEIFEWVVDDAEITIDPIAPDHSSELTQAAEEQSMGMPVEGSSATEGSLSANGSLSAEGSLSVGAVKPAAVAQPGKSESGSIRVDIDKIDTMINMVGELVITQSMLGQIGTEFTPDKLTKLQEGLQDLERNVQVLHESVMQVRMLPISFTFNRFPRMVRDLGRQLDKKIDLVVKGEATELDKTVMEKIGDPLVHLLRNSSDHGIEIPADRIAAGKSQTGVITLTASHRGGYIVIEISDDGRGLPKEKIKAKAVKNGLVDPNDTLSDEQIQDLIFQPGFSTADKISDISGRGVGMDVVRKNIQALGGTVTVKSVEGVGSTFTITLPLTLAILEGQLVRVGREIFVFPLVSILESLSVNKSQINTVGGSCDLIRLRDDYIPIIPLYKAFGIEPDSLESENLLVVVVESEGVKVGLMVDELQAQQQVVIKSLESNYRSVQGISGATILGDGTVSLILDIPGVVRIAEQYNSDASSEAA